jgi:hypothetical protein
VSTLSRLESGDRKPTLELLLPLARAHGVTLDELVGAPPTGNPRVHPRPVTRDGLTMLPLTPRAGGIQYTRGRCAALGHARPSPMLGAGCQQVTRHDRQPRRHEVMASVTNPTSSL